MTPTSTFNPEIHNKSQTQKTNKTIPTEDEILCRNVPFGRELIKNARVAVAGLGGLGSLIAVCLARSGIGRLHLVDFDVVEPSNLNRQQYKICHIGMSKVDALAQELSQINPYVELTTDCIKITPNNIARLFCDDDIICEALDGADAKAMLALGILTHFPQKIVVCGSGMAGYDSSNLIKTTRRYHGLYVCGDGQSDLSKSEGIMAPRVAICAAHQANMVLRLILKEFEP